jgi:hypothetical protein
MFSALREHFAHESLVEGLMAVHRLSGLRVTRAVYEPKNHSYRAEFTGVSTGGHDVRGTVVLDRQKAIWIGCNHPLLGYRG